ncbi:MAG: bifunctional diaminohydroxyphosphoribosylaminopyrimidine deaminase/5-amino-6-(5-phosphoribosylamino)uracil reductase RibD [Pelotomaculum sp.]|jgi:diaminohydroxyphosphoribosylaminopyrimidine deaminase/5-amino-6-(5-phosphoribosylamino)uracil reductase
MDKIDHNYMKLALQLAARAQGRTSPNPLVGAVIVSDNRIVGRGYHQKAGTPHAEIHALNEAGAAARGGTLYVNLEPCSHFGRTGPCCEAVIEAGIAKVVVAMADPNPLVAGQGLKRLSEAGIDVELGIMEEEARRLNEVFIKYINTRLPFVVVKAAVSLDGKIATRTGKSQWITGPEARAYGHQLRNRYDAIMVGVGTVLADDPSLTTRLPGPSRDPVRIILDSQGRTPPGAKVLNQQSDAPTLIAVTREAPRKRLLALREAGAEILVVSKGPRVDLVELMKLLGAREITSILLEGGGTVHSAALEAGIVDKVCWFIAPKIIGGDGAPGAVGGLGVDDPDEAVQLERVRMKCLGEDFCLEGYIKYRGG